MRILIFFLSLFLILSGYGQVIIYPENTFNSGDFATMANVPEAPPGFSHGNSGPDQVWDFSGFVSDTTFHILFLDPADTPYGSEFPGSNIALNRVSYLDSVLMYAHKDDSIYQFLGLVGQFEQYSNVIAHVTPPQTSVLFPIQYQDSVHSLSLMEFKIDPDSPGVDSVWVRIWFDSYVVADAWGVLTTPVNTYDVLRLKSVHYRTDSTWVMTNGVWEFYETDDGIRVEWDYFADTEYYPVVEYASDISGTYFGWFSYLISYGPMPYIGEYASDIPSQIYPVPATDMVTASWDKKREGEILVFDITGRLAIRKTFLKSNEIKIYVSGLNEGSYLYRINFTDDEMFSTGKIIIQ